jgi:hypothetical protein
MAADRIGQNRQAVRSIGGRVGIGVDCQLFDLRCDPADHPGNHRFASQQLQRLFATHPP